MSPEIEQYLAGMKKTIEEVILPNLSDRFAQEQAGIIAASLGFLGLVQDKAFHYELFENQQYKQFFQKLDSLCANLDNDKTLQNLRDKISAQFQHDAPDSPAHLRPYKFLRASNEVMKELLSEFIQTQPNMPAALRSEFEDLLAPFFKAIETRERSWVKSLGFDPEAEQQADIADLLYRDGYLDVSTD